MLNALLLNTAQLNSGTPLPFAVTASDYDAIEFNGYSLQDSDHISSQIDAWSTPSRELVTFDIPRANGAGLNGDYFRKREVVVSGIIQKATGELLTAELDAFKKAMTASEGYLTLKVNDEVRRIVATLQNPEEMFKRREGYHVSFTPFDLNFLALEPMFHGIDYSSLTFEDISALDYPVEVEVFGTYRADPVFISILQEATSVTAFTLTNTTNGDEMTITANLSAGDVIIIDSENKSVTINGVEVDYDGVFPEMEIGTNSFSLTFTGTSVEHTSTIKYRKTYL